MNEEDRKMLSECHSMLTRICAYIDKVESKEWQSKCDLRAFSLNVIADIFVEGLENGTEQNL